MEMRVGVDFDNTIVTYGSLVHRVAVDWGLVSDDLEKDKTVVRDQIRRLPDGEIKWQKVQAEIYGPRMNEAQLIEGVRRFFVHCRCNNIPTYIVSHKTQYANFDQAGVDLRMASLAWMTNEGFFAENGLALSLSDVFFETTRLEKVERIKRLRCTHFIDDLEEVFLEATFPSSVKKILFNVRSRSVGLPDITLASSWKEISDSVFGLAN